MYVKINFLIIILLFSFSLFSQTDKSTKDKVYYHPFPPSLLYGSKFLQSSYFNKQLNSFNNLKINSPISMIGVCLSEGMIVIGKWPSFEPHVYYSQILPQTITINDSLTTKVGGFQVGLGLWGKDLFKFNNIGNIAFTLGFNTGRLKFYGNENIMRSNSFFSPKITLQPSIRIWRIKLSVLIDYEYDISNKNWRNLRSATAEQIPIKKLSQTGFTGQLNVGFFLKSQSKKDKKIAKKKKNNGKKQKKER